MSIRIGPAYFSLAMTAVKRPSLVPGLLRTAWTFRSKRWYLRPPFLPVPPRGYLRWRMETAYGDADARLPPDEIERYVRWGEEMRKRIRGKLGE